MVADQGANSVFSLVAGFAAAWLLSTGGFGLFGTLFAVLLITRGVARAVVLEPLQIRFAGRSVVPGGSATTAVMMLFGVMAAVVAVWGVATGTVDGPLLGGFAAGAVLLGMSDSVRAVEVTAARPVRAMTVSSVMLVVLAAGAGLLVVVDAGVGEAFVGVGPARLEVDTGAAWWWLAIGFAAVAGMAALGAPVRGDARPGPVTGALRWVWEERRLSAPLLLDFAASAGVAHAAVVVLAAGDLAEAGALRGAMLAAGPLQFVLVALAQFLIVESARVEPGRADRLGAVTALVAAVAGGGWLLVVGVGGDALESLLGDSGAAARAVVPAAVVMTIATAPGLLASSLMRTRGLAARAARLRVALAVPLLGALAFGAATTGATGVAWWTALVHAASAPVWWLALRRERALVRGSWR